MRCVLDLNASNQLLPWIADNVSKTTATGNKNKTKLSHHCQSCTVGDQAYHNHHQSAIDWCDKLPQPLQLLRFDITYMKKQARNWRLIADSCTSAKHSWQLLQISVWAYMQFSDNCLQIYREKKIGLLLKKTDAWWTFPYAEFSIVAKPCIPIPKPRNQDLRISK